MPEEKPKEPRISSFMRVVGAHDPVFNAGDLGNTMFLILEGKIRIYEKVDGIDRLMGILDKGEAMGERALLATSVYRRPYTAIAERETTLLEFGAQHIPHIETIVPNFALKVLQSNILKLDRANELIRVLRKTHPIERVIHFLLFFIHHYGSKSPQGIELEISGPEIAIWTSVDEEICEECLGELVNRKALDKKKNAYVVKDENLLTQWSFHLKERIAV